MTKQSRRLLKGFLAASGFIALCVLLRPSILPTNDGISYFGVFWATLIPYAAALIIYEYSLWQTAKAMGHGRKVRFAALAMKAIAILIVAILLTPISWVENPHTVIAGILFLLQIIVSLIMISWGFHWIDAGLITVEFLAGAAGLYYAARDQGPLLQSQIIFQVAFAALVIRAVSLLRGDVAMPISSVSDRARAAKLLRTHALTSEDYFKLWPADKAYFWSASRDAFIAYRVVDSIAFALAEPVATSDAERQQILQDFQAYCRSQEWYLCFLLVGEGTKRRYEALGLKTVKMGASAMVSLKTFTTQTANDKWWRWHRNNGNKLGYVYEFHTPPHAKSLLVDMRQVSNAWLVDGQRREQGFALGYFDEAYLQKCTLHVLRNKYGNVIAFVNEVPRFNHLSGATLDLMRFLPDTPHAMPYLFLNMLQTLQEVGHLTYFDLGFVPLARMQGRLPAIARLIGARRFSAAGLEQFKNKFDPDWQPNYLAYDGDLKDLAYIALNLERVVSIDPTVPAG